MNDERKELMEAATTLIAELRRITGPVNAVINRLIERADKGKVDDADAMEEARGIVTRKIGVRRLGAVGRGRVSAAPPIDPKQVRDVPRLNAAEALAEADKQKKQRRKRGPVSPERKTQLAEQLKKARAARKFAKL